MTPPSSAVVFAAAVALVAFALVPRPLPRLFAVLGWCLLWWDGAVGLSWHDLAGAIVVVLSLAAVFHRRHPVERVDRR